MALSRISLTSAVVINSFGFFTGPDFLSPHFGMGSPNGMDLKVMHMDSDKLADFLRAL